MKKELRTFFLTRQSNPGRFGPAFRSPVTMVTTLHKQQIDFCFSLILGRDGRDGKNAAEVGGNHCFLSFDKEVNKFYEINWVPVQ